MSTHVISYDIGTTGIKTCLFEISEEIKLIASTTEGYALYVLENGGVEQEPEEWWLAMQNSTRRLLEESQFEPHRVKGISFCAQMQGVVLTDHEGYSVRRAMSYMDNRAGAELEAVMHHGIKIAGVNLFKLIKSLRLTGAVSASVKDPVWKYKWVENNEPEIFNRIYKWLDVKEFLICKCTDAFVMTEDSAFATLLYDTRKNHRRFSSELCKMMGVKESHLPKVIKSSDIAGTLTEKAANALGLAIGTPVFGGGGDASLIGVGAGAVETGATHIYLGTSGWVSTVVDRQILDIKNMIASIIGSDSGRYNYFAELETAGKCLEWVRDHLALDEIDIYIEKKQIHESREALFKSLYEYMIEAIKNVPAGSHGVIFTPWLHGNRCPFEDPNARGMFFNISLDTGKTELIHAVLEGICYHLRWQLESQEEKIKTSKAIRLVGGGALAPLTCQILADILGREIETVDNPQNAGAMGAAVLVAIGLGIKKSVVDTASLIKSNQVYKPNPDHKGTYDRYFDAFKALYRDNKQTFKILNASHNSKH